MVSSSKFKPEGHNSVAPYLLVKQGQRMIDFLRAVFEAQELERVSGPQGTLRHAELRIDDSIVMLGERPEPKYHASTHVYMADVDLCYERALAHGAKSVVAPRDLQYGDRTAGFEDPEGNVWWIGTRRAG